MKKQILTILLVGLCFPIFAQMYVNKMWENDFGTPDTVAWSASMIDGQGNMTVVGNTTGTQGNADILVSYYDSEGNLIWQDTYNHTTNGNDYGIAVSTDYVGGVYIAGAVADGNGALDWLVRKYDTNGNDIWTTFYNHVGYDVPTAMTVSVTGEVFVTGITTNISSQTDYLTIKYDASGNQEWAQSYDYQQLKDIPVGISMNNNGDIIITGGSQSMSNSADYFTLVYDTNGALLNTDRQNVAGTGMDKPAAIARDNAGNIVVTGLVQNGTNTDIRTLKFDSNFALQWAQTYDKAGLEDVAKSIATDAYGNVFITGYSTDSIGNRQIVIIKYDASGNQVWVRNWQYKTKTGSFPTEAVEIVADAQGNIYIAGNIYNGTNTAVIMLGYDTNGNLKWEKQENGTTSELISHTNLLGNKLYVLKKGKNSGNNYYENTQYETFRRVNEYVSDSLGNHKYLKNQVLVRFSPSATLPNLFQNREKTHGKLSDFITPNVITQMESKLDLSLTDAIVAKILPYLTPNDTISYSRMGEMLRLDSYWTNLLLFLPQGDRALQDEAAIADTLTRMKPMIFYASPNYVYSYMVGSNDPKYSNDQESLHLTPTADYQINVPQAWDMTTGRNDIRVGVYDSGITWGHPDLTTNGDGTWQNSVVYNGYDFEHLTGLDNINSASNDINGHGTNVAGIIGACRNNKDASGNYVGIAGVAGGDYTSGTIGLTGVQLDMMRVGDLEPSLDAMSAAIYYGTINTTIVPTGIGWGQHIMNFSVGSLDYNPFLRIAMAEAYRHKIILVCGRGNNSAAMPDPDEFVFPASLNQSFGDWVISVGGTDEFGMRPGAIKRGHVDISAPCVPDMITTTAIGDTYSDFLGTSASAPHISGIAALLLSYFNQLNPSTSNLAPEDVENLMNLYADQTSTTSLPDIDIGYGVADAGNTLQHVKYPYYDLLHIQTNVDWTDMVFQGAQNFYLEYDLDLAGYIIPAGWQSVDIFKFTKQVDAAPYIPSNWSVIHTWGTSSMSDYFPDFTNTTYDNSIFNEPHISFTPDILDLTKGSITGYAYQFYHPASGSYPAMPNASGAGNVTFSVHIKNDVLTGIAPMSVMNNGFILYPNPTSGIFEINLKNDNKIACVEISDLTGRKVKKYCLENISATANIDVRDISKGMYLITVNDSKNNIFTDKFIKH